MSFNNISYPNLIYIQSTQPADLTAGRIWSDTDDGKLYVSNGSAYNAIGGGMTLLSTETLESEKTQINFTIPSDYKFFKIVGCYAQASETSCRMRIDGSTASNYMTVSTSNGSSASPTTTSSWYCDAGSHQDDKSLMLDISVSGTEGGQMPSMVSLCLGQTSSAYVYSSAGRNENATLTSSQNTTINLIGKFTSGTISFYGYN